MTTRRYYALRAWGVGTGAVTTAATIVVSAALLESVSVTPKGVIAATLIVEVVGFALDRGTTVLLRRYMREKQEDLRNPNYALGALVMLALGCTWMVVGFAAADYLLAGFDIEGVWAYLCTLAINAALVLAVWVTRPPFARETMDSAL